MTVSQHRPPALEWRVFRGSEAVARGLLTDGQLRGKAWMRVRHDVYADARLDRDHGLACRATMARLPAAVLAGPSAAFLHGVGFAASGHDDVHVIVGAASGRRSASQTGVRVHRLRLDPVDVCSVASLPATAPARTAWDVAVWLPTPRAVAVVDALLSSGSVSPASLDEVAERLADRPGGRRAAHAFSLADAASASAAESALRVRLLLAGLPRPVVGLSLVLRGGVHTRAAFAWPEHRVALIPWLVDAPSSTESGGWSVLRPGTQRLARELPTVVRDLRQAMNAHIRAARSC